MHVEKILFDSRSNQFTEPQLSLLLGQVETARWWLTRIVERFVIHDTEGVMPEVKGLGAAELLVRHRESVEAVKACRLH